jgi:membrane-associated protein
MHDFWNSIQHVIDPEKLLKEGGFYVVLFVIFAETGLFFGTGRLDVNIFVLLPGLMAAAILGNFTGYWFGRKTGPVLYQREDTFFFKKRYLRAAEAYYTKQGAFALIMGRFVPIVRTFAPIIAGVVRLEFKKFALYNIIGAILWIASLTLLGYFLGKKFEKEISQYLLYIILGFITITTIPVLYAFFKRRTGLNQTDNK